MIKFIQKKVNITTIKNWSHHLDGWNYVVKECYEKIHNPKGINLYTNGIFSEIKNKKIKLDIPWIGVCHLTKTEIEKINFKEEIWINNFKNCLFIITHSNFVGKILEEKTNCNILSIMHPYKKTNKKFEINNFNKNICFIGKWLRRFDRFNLFETSYKKININENFVNKEEYENILKNNIIFTDLEDSCCNNTILECIARNTPIIINKLPSVVEYLGDNYPLYFNNIEELNKIEINYEKIKLTHEYLNRIDKTKFTSSEYLKNIINYKFYKYI